MALLGIAILHSVKERSPGLWSPIILENRYRHQKPRHDKKSQVRNR